MNTKQRTIAILVSVMSLFMSGCRPGQLFGPTFTPTATLTPTMTPIPTLTPKPALGIGSTHVSSKDKMVMVYVPEGEFIMGSTDADIEKLMADCSSCDRSWFTPELPQRTIYLDAFWMDRTEVTNSQYAQCVADGKCRVPIGINSATHNNYYGNSQYDDYPVIDLDWNQASAYCAWAGRRLPTEAEWEKAARGTDGRIYPWDNQPPDKTLANYNQNVRDTTKVGSYPFGVSPYGALDMAGNVWEWVADWYSDTYYQQSPRNNPTGPGSGQYRVLRGGSWHDGVGFLRAAYRIGNPPDLGANLVGFRCANPLGG